MVNEIDANVWSTSAPKMERASIFLHVASGILKIASLEAGKSENCEDGRKNFGNFRCFSVDRLAKKTTHFIYVFVY